MFFNLLIVLLTVVAMEIFSVVAHKHIMHGFGWNWHKSHHEPHPEGRTFWLEKNDLYAVFFAGVAIALIWFGTEGRHPLEWIGAGMTASTTACGWRKTSAATRGFSCGKASSLRYSRL